MHKYIAKWTDWSKAATEKSSFDLTLLETRGQTCKLGALFLQKGVEEREDTNKARPLLSVLRRYTIIT